jgi:hypothetical protein
VASQVSERIGQRKRLELADGGRSAFWGYTPGAEFSIVSLHRALCNACKNSLEVLQNAPIRKFI